MTEGVRDNTVRSRFELEADGIVAFAQYTLAGPVITLTHTEVPPQARGRGLASRLIEGALDDVRARGLKVVPRCAFVRAFIERHPQYRDLLA